MDERMMRDLLATYGNGIPLNARNANAIREFAAANPNVLEHRAMRMRGSVVDDNSDLLNAYLDKVAEDTAAPPGRVEVGEPVKDTVQAPAPAALPAKKQDYSAVVPPPAQGTYASNKGNYDDKSTYEDLRKGVPRVSGYEVPPDTSASEPAFEIPNWLKVILGIAPSAGVVAKGAERANRFNAATDDPTPVLTEQRRLPGGQYENLESTGQDMRDVTDRNATMKEARRKELQSQIDHDNRKLEDEIIKQTRQRQTEELARRAGRATGRR